MDLIGLKTNGRYAVIRPAWGSEAPITVKIVSDPEEHKGCLVVDYQRSDSKNENWAYDYQVDEIHPEGYEPEYK